MEYIRSSCKNSLTTYWKLPGKINRHISSRREGSAATRYIFPSILENLLWPASSAGNTFLFRNTFSVFWSQSLRHSCPPFAKRLYKMHTFNAYSDNFLLFLFISLGNLTYRYPNAYYLHRREWNRKAVFSGSSTVPLRTSKRSTSSDTVCPGPAFTFRSPKEIYWYSSMPLG